MSALCLEPKFSGDELGSNFPHVLTSVEIEITSWNADSDAKFPIHRMKMVPVYRHANEFCPKENVNLFSPILLWTCLWQLSGSIMNEWVKHFDMCLFSLYMSIIILLFFFFWKKKKLSFKTVVKSQRCDWLFWDLKDCSLPGSVHGILQARILEWVAISFSRGSSPPRDWTGLSHIVGEFFTA